MKALRRHTISVFSSLANFIYPPFCSNCKKKVPDGLWGGICGTCWAEVKIWGDGHCQRCGTNVSGGTSLCRNCLIPDWGCGDIRTIGPFEAPLSDAIHMLKYSDAQSVSQKLGFLMAGRIGSGTIYSQAEMVLAVPLHGARKRERGYNQAQLLAEQLGKALGVPAPEGVVLRARHTKSQTTMNKEQRRKNVEGIFAVRKPEKIKGKTVILVDDVLTTGATIGSCGHALLAAGAVKVLAMTAAAAPL